MNILGQHSPTNFQVYHNLLEAYLASEEKDEELRKLFDDIITSTHYWIMGDLAEDSIHYSIYSLVKALSKQEYQKRYFIEVDVKTIGTKQYKSLLGILVTLLKKQEK